MTALRSLPLLPLVLLLVVVVIVTVAAVQALQPVRCTYLSFDVAGTPIATSEPFAVDGSARRCS